MTTRESLVAALADRPGDHAARLVFADWLDDHGEPDRAAFVRASCAADRERPGSPRRAELLDEADALLARHEAEWLGDWRGRLLDWEFRRGFLHRVRMTAADFLAHAADLFRREPVGRVELVEGENGPLGADAVREVVAHPAFASVRDCAIEPHPFLTATPIGVWMASLAGNPHVSRLRRFGPIGSFDHSSAPDDGMDQKSFAAFCQACHLRTLRHLDLSVARLNSHVSRPWLVPLLAKAPFAATLRSLTLDGMGVPAEGFAQLATDPVFGSLRALHLSESQVVAGAWAGVFESTTLTGVTALTIGADRLPLYAGSPMARRVRDLSVVCAADLDRDLAPDRRAWLELIANAPPPRRLQMRCHNPGGEAFEAMRRARWLRHVRELSISGDSQYEVYAGRTDGIRVLFGPREMPKLAVLKLHEVCDPDVLRVLSAWQGLGRLETLELTDDYHGRLVPADLERQPESLRTLRGVVLWRTEDVERLAAWPRLYRVGELQVSFCSGDPSPGAAERLLRGEGLRNVREATIGFHHAPEVAGHVAEVLADERVMPRLRRLRTYGNYGDELPAAEGLRARFGRRLEAR